MFKECLLGVASLAVAALLQIAPAVAEEPATEASDSSAPAVKFAADEATVATSCDPCCLTDCCKPEKKWTAGGGLRTSWNFIENNSPNGVRWSNDLNLDNVRLFFSGQACDYLGLTINADINNAQGFDDPTDGFEDAGEFRVLDAIVKYEPGDLFNVWMGRFNLPIDRQNISGPYYINAWSFPYAALGYTDLFQGRDDGVAVWGQVGGGIFKYQAGVFKGIEGAPNVDDHVMIAGRATLNLLDPEPGYYTQSTYHGEKDILAFGLAFQQQADAFVAGFSHTIWSLDVLFEMGLGVDNSAGVITLEADYFDDREDDAVSAVTVPQFRQGTSYLLYAGYMLPWKMGSGILRGQLRPFVRYQDYDRSAFAAAPAFTAGNTARWQYDVGADYVIDGHNARLVLVLENRETGPGSMWLDAIRIGAQVQY